MNQHFAEKQKAKLNAPAFQQFLSLILCPLHLYKSIRLLKKKKGVNYVEATEGKPRRRAASELPNSSREGSH